MPFNAIGLRVFECVGLESLKENCHRRIPVSYSGSFGTWPAPSHAPVDHMCVSKSLVFVGAPVSWPVSDSPLKKSCLITLAF
jgi:hypothetical protein